MAPAYDGAPRRCQRSDAHQRGEAAADHSAHVGGLLCGDHLPDPRVLHHPGHDLVAVLARGELGHRDGHRLALADREALPEVVAAELAVAQGAALAGHRAERRRLELVGPHVPLGDGQQVDVHVGADRRAHRVSFRYDSGVAWIDVSVPVRTGMIVYDGDPVVTVERVAEVERGDVATVSRLDLGSHTGTHVDAPSHILAGGGPADRLPLDALIGPALVADARGAPGDIDSAALAALAVPAGTERVLFRTRNGDLWDREGFTRDYVGLAEDAARELVALGVPLVGIAYLSIAPSADPVPTHRVLLDAGVVIVEGLDLRAAPPGRCELVCLPLRIEGGDGAPARALLRPLG